MLKQNHDIDAVILCGGFGTRLKSVLKNQPKSMAKIDKKPFLDILIEYAAGFGFKRFILCAGYKVEVIEKHYAVKKNNLEILVSREKEPLGTAGAIRNAQKLIKSNYFLAMNGDSFCPVDLGSFIAFHLNKKALISIVLSKTMAGKDYGNIVLSDSQRIVQFNEKAIESAGDFVNSGIYLFDKAILSFIPEGKKFSLEYDFFPTMINKKIYGYVAKESFLDIGTPERYEKAKKALEGL